ncbi:MAG: Ig-like domain-containing protein, partial [Myxococcota bacterium]|nr:Ig-like domain-containing protein [Myxococcota bacterium]
SHTWSVDSIAPDTTILTAPAAVSTTTSASFTFSATESGSSFQCRLDAGTWASCTSPVALTVGQGSHTWEVRATDAAGNQDPSPASHTWFVDSVAPAAPVVTAPVEDALLAQDTVTLGGTSEPGTVVTVTVDGVSVGTAPTNASGLWELTNVGPLSEGAHAVEAVASDAAGNLSLPGLSTFRTDTLPPETTVDSGPASLIATKTALFDFGSNESPVTFSCRLDGVDLSNCLANLELNDLAEGPHLLSVFATDEAGNSDLSPATHAWTVDTVAPDTTLDAQPANPTASRTGTFAFSSSEPSSTFQCQLDGAGAFASCPSPSSFTNLPSGPHTFQVRAVDAAGNVDPTPASYAWTVNGDRDGDGLLDLDEATHGTDPDDPDTDNDGLSDGLEVQSGRTSPLDDDSDDDGLLDGTEDANGDGLVSPGETNGAARDSDGDGLTDGLELGLTAPEGTGTDPALFVADQDPSTQTDPLVADTDSGGVWDGYEDRNHNGRVDPEETNPLLGSDDIDADGDGLHNEHEVALGLDPFDSDTDDDGIADGEDGILDTDGDGLIDAADPDSDNDGLPDGLEAGVTAATAPGGTDQGSASFVPDQDPTTTTDPKVADTDGDGLADGAEDLNGNGRYDPDETDPLLADTDHGGLSDGAEREHGLDPTWDGDDWGVGGSGCSSSGGGLSSLSLLMLAGLWLRRRLAGVGRAAATAALLLWAPGVQAQTTAPKSTAIDVQQFKPAPGGSDLLSLHSALVPEHFSWQVGLLGSYGNDPLTVTNPITGQATSAVVAHQATFDLYGSIGLFQRFELGVALPLTLQGTQSDPFDGQTLRGAGVGDLRLVPKAKILRLAGIELAAALPVILPTGGESSFLGGGGLAVQPRVIAEWAPGPLRVIANLGFNFRRTEQLQNLHVGHAFTYGAGLEVPMQLPVVGDLALGATLVGSLGLIQNDPEERPLELLLMGRWTSFIPGLRVVGGGGPGVTHGYGTPRFRMFLGVDWTPGGRQAATRPDPVTPAVP